ncbi:MAG: hypothetical protein ACXVH0_06070 [Thermoanaerobaculia bacterium]
MSFPRASRVPRAALGAGLVLLAAGLFTALKILPEWRASAPPPVGHRNARRSDRPRTVLESTSLWRRPPESIVEALFADWRLHVGEGAPSDDTTILVVKRPLF